MSIRRRLLSGDIDTPQARLLKKGEETGGLDITLRDSSGVQDAWDIEITVEQSGTAGYTADLINVVETTVGSGDKKLIDRQIGGVSMFSVDRLGAAVAASVNLGNDTLSMYQEGEYNPTVIPSTSGSYSYGTDNTFAFTRIGRLCHVQGILSVSGASAPVGNLKVSLPFAPASLTETADESAPHFTLIAHGGVFEGTYLDLDPSNGAFANLSEIKNDGTQNPITAAEVDTSFFIAVNFTYVVDQ